MKKRSVIITGANSGIGRAAAERFANEGYKVVMACRNLEKGRQARNEIRELTGNGEIFLYKLDMSSLKSIRNFCERFQREHTSLDILINNAAYFNHGEDFQLSPDKVELTFATNVVGPYLLTILLSDLLAESDDPRILNAGSNIIKHFFDPKKEVRLSGLSGNQVYEPHSVYKCYRDSKMAFLMQTFRMSEVLKEKGIKVNMLQINGAKMSKDTLRKTTYPWRSIAHVQNLFFREPQYMADLYFQICTSENFKNVTGKLFNHKLEIMQPASEKPGLKAQFQQLFGTELYPVYAHRQDITDLLWSNCRVITKTG